MDSLTQFDKPKNPILFDAIRAEPITAVSRSIWTMMAKVAPAQRERDTEGQRHSDCWSGHLS